MRVGSSRWKIDYCRNNDMIFWGDDNDLIVCRFCHEKRYKQVDRADTSKWQKTYVSHKKMHYFPLTPQLLRLYASNSTVMKMRSHANHAVKDSVVRHLSDSPHGSISMRLICQIWSLYWWVSTVWSIWGNNILLGLSLSWCIICYPRCVWRIR